MIRTLVMVLLLAAPVLGQGYVCAEGGGNAGKGAWADEVFGWMVDKGGHGKVVLLGAVKLEEDDRPALFTRLGARSVESLVVTQENADAQATFDAITSASVVFIRGGAQDRYVRYWKGTKTQRAIVEVWKKGGVVAGTSAGCAVLGEVVYDAMQGSLIAVEAITDSCSPRLTLTTGFLDLVPGVLFDTHFSERGRLARLPVMLAHCKQDLGRNDVLGIGVDPRTAVCIGPDGIAEIRGEGTATILCLTKSTRVQLVKQAPPTVTDLSYSQLCAGYTYDLKGRAVVRRPEGIAPRPGAKAFERRTEEERWFVGGGSEERGVYRLVVRGADAWMEGPIAMNETGSKLDFVVIVPAALSGDSTANNMVGVQIALADHPGLVGLWVAEGAGARVTNAGGISVLGSEGARSVLLLDATDPLIRTGHGPPPRRAPVLEGARFNLLGPNWLYEASISSAREVKP